MNRQASQLITRAAINKIGNMLYDYGNSIWLASMGALGQTVLGIYQISELVTSILSILLEEPLRTAFPDVRC